MTDDVMAAWAAGLMDGDGSVSLHVAPSRASYRFRLRVGMTEPEPLERLRALFGGNVNAVRPNLSGRPHNVWAVAGARAVDAARRMLPYATAKRERLRLFIEAWETKQAIPLVSGGAGSGRGGHTLSPESLAMLADYSARIRTLNAKGPRGATVLPGLVR